MGMLLRRYYDETYTNPVDLESLNLVELRKLGKEHGIPKAHLKGKAELCELLKELV